MRDERHRVRPQSRTVVVDRLGARRMKVMTSEGKLVHSIRRVYRRIGSHCVDPGVGRDTARSQPLRHQPCMSSDESFSSLT